ncbi:LPXTG cell wall anchor domain-containing protein [Kitasatospora sp. NPDC049258]|uniref:LPXTG cell wall anchor domain-containing protein n=1 Tax=Kitasatospora sp. NPDC049258 TaxID=3155394 RepID=UPI0034357FFD
MRRVTRATAAALALATSAALATGAPAPAVGATGPGDHATARASHSAAPAPRLTITGAPQSVSAGGSARFTAELLNTTGTDLVLHPAVQISDDHHGLPVPDMSLRYKQPSEMNWHTSDPVTGPGNGIRLLTPAADDTTTGNQGLLLVPAGKKLTLALDLGLPPGLEDSLAEIAAVAYWAPAGPGGTPGTTTDTTRSEPQRFCITRPGSPSPSATARTTVTPIASTSTAPSPTPQPALTSSPLAPEALPVGAVAVGEARNRSVGARVLASTGGGADPALIAAGLAFLAAGTGIALALRRRRAAGRHTY